jgi:mono/diheme cytochrome c family protein
MPALWAKAAALGAVLIVAGVAATVARADDAAVSSADLDALSGAREIFQDNCAACHGYDGIPMVPGAANFAVGERLDKSDEELLGIINLGKNDMPPWEGMLEPDEQAVALFYVRQLAGDMLFQDNCVGCHESGVPPLGVDMPSNDELAGQAEKLDVCGGSDAEAALDQTQIVAVVGFLRRLAGRSAE